MKYKLTVGGLVRRLQVFGFLAEDFQKSPRQLDIEGSENWGQE